MILIQNTGSEIPGKKLCARLNELTGQQTVKRKKAQLTKKAKAGEAEVADETYEDAKTGIQNKGQQTVDHHSLQAYRLVHDGDEFEIMIEWKSSF